MKTIKLSVLSLISLISLGLGAQSLDEAKRLSSNEQFEDAEKVLQMFQQKSGGSKSLVSRAKKK